MTHKKPYSNTNSKYNELVNFYILGQRSVPCLLSRRDAKLNYAEQLLYMHTVCKQNRQPPA